ncbi:MAG: TerB family tellurite resistance protein [Myxococcales bacterium]|nr:MAG: TerB family tellurite resistance protein [Myxococcales bacterium]
MMRTLLERLKGTKATGQSFSSELEAAIAERLPKLDPARRRALAAFAGLLGSAARADLDFSADEEARIRAILVSFAELPKPEAAVVAGVIREAAPALAGLEDDAYIKILNEEAPIDQKKLILSCLFAVAAADEEISSEENERIRQISVSLKLSQVDFFAVRSLYRDKLSVLKNLPGASGG